VHTKEDRMTSHADSTRFDDRVHDENLDRLRDSSAPPTPGAPS
jgi:hypothetical protein